jgi:hypothetical protein
VWKGDGEAVVSRVGLCLSHPAGATRAEGLPIKIHLVLCPIYVFSLCLPEKIKDFKANVDGFFSVVYIHIYYTYDDLSCMLSIDPTTHKLIQPARTP